MGPERWWDSGLRKAFSCLLASLAIFRALRLKCFSRFFFCFDCQIQKQKRLFKKIKTIFFSFFDYAKKNFVEIFQFKGRLRNAHMQSSGVSRIIIWYKGCGFTLSNIAPKGIMEFLLIFQCFILLFWAWFCFQ